MKCSRSNYSQFLDLALLLRSSVKIEKDQNFASYFSLTDGKFLAVGSHDNFVDIYSVRRGKRTGVCKGSSSYITHLDWDTKGKHFSDSFCRLNVLFIFVLFDNNLLHPSGKLIQTNSGAREHLFYEAPTGNRKTISVPDVERLQWSSFTCVLGPTVKGVFPPGSDITDVNAACCSKDGSLLASGDDFGLVKVFKYPVSVSF